MCQGGLSVPGATIAGMPLCDYFSAPDDQAAVAVLPTGEGPGQAGFDTVGLKNIDPVVAMARLEAILTGCAYEEARALPRAGRLLSDPEDEAAFVVSVTDTLTATLASASPEDIARCAGPWSRTGELRELGISAEDTAGALEALAGLARRARGSGRRLYCWWAL